MKGKGWRRQSGILCEGELAWRTQGRPAIRSLGARAQGGEMTQGPTSNDLARVATGLPWADLRVLLPAVYQNLPSTMPDTFEKPPQSGWAEGTGGGKGT